MFGFVYYWRLKVRFKKELQLLDQKRDIWLKGEIGHNEYMGCLKGSVLMIREELAKIKVKGGSLYEVDRCIAFEGQRGGFVKNYGEEQREFEKASFRNDEFEMIDALCDLCILMINAGLESYGTKTPAFFMDVIKNMGYDPEKCLLETIKEIESRTGAWCEKSKKWIKDTSEEAKAKWYKADYSKCKLG